MKLKPLFVRLLLAQRWDKVVDFGSPMSAWTPEMLTQFTAAKEKS